jgi:hypothetical protein
VSLTEFLANFFLASVPGVLIALLAFVLQIRRDNQLEARASQNARQLLSLEVEGNRTALADFLKEINDLDTEQAEITSDDHLTAITENGFLTHPLPHWNLTRWQPAQPSWLNILDEKEVELIDRFYRGLELVADLHTRLVTLNPQEQEMMANDRFWASRYTSMRNLLFPRWVEVVNRTLTAENPLRSST